MGSEIILENLPLIAVIGPTATGKSDLAIALAKLTGAEIVSADSMQIYRFMDIGTAKPSKSIRQMIPHHFIDILNPDETYSAGLFSRQAHALITRKLEDKIPLIIVGGTGLYIKALERGLVELPPIPKEIQTRLWEEFLKIGLEPLYKRLRNFDPALAEKIHPNDRFRILRALGIIETTGTPLSTIRERHGFKDTAFRILKIGLTYPREILYKRIEKRVDRMKQNGWLDEVNELLKMGYGETLKPLQAIGYKQFIKVLRGGLTLDSAIDEIKKETRRLAKRQITWFKKEAPHLWINPEESSFHEIADNLLSLIRKGALTWTQKKG